MRLKTLLPVLLLFGAIGCDSILDVEPINEISEEQAIVDPTSARAALAGIYDALQDDEYYGGDFYFFSDLSAEDVTHTGTFTTYRQMDLNAITADNSTLEVVWDRLYESIGRINTVIAKVPTVEGLGAEEADQMVGEALFVRALTYHNLVKLWGERTEGGLGVPLLTAPVAGLGEASQVTRATTGAIYAQILEDLDAAESLMSVADATTTASLGAVHALRARVQLYRGNWVEAEAEAEAVAAMGYSLAGSYEDLFEAEGAPTPEDIFRVAFTSQEFNWIGYYYRARGEGGRYEIAPSTALLQAYDADYVPGTPATYAPADLRGQHNISFRGTNPFGSKWPTGAGAEDIHVIRFAEVLLIKAEAEARQGGAAKLQEAVNSLNAIRVRAGLLPLVYGVDVTTDQQVLDAIFRERRLELAFEADRWPDLVRREAAVATLGIPEYQTLYPIPLNELDVAPNLQQNPGY